MIHCCELRVYARTLVTGFSRFEVIYQYYATTLPHNLLSNLINIRRSMVVCEYVIIRFFRLYMFEQFTSPYIVDNRQQGVRSGTLQQLGQTGHSLISTGIGMYNVLCQRVVFFDR